MDEWSEYFSVQVENARWLIDRESLRIDGIHQRASYLLGFTGVILAILPSTLNPVSHIHGHQMRNTAFSLLICATLLLALGAFTSLLTVAVRFSPEVPLIGMQKRWIASTETLSQPNSSQVLADIANALMGRGTQARDSAVLSIRAEGDVRARRLRISVWLTSAGILVLGSVLVVLLGSTLSV